MDSPFSRLELLVADLTSAITPFLDRSFAFFGHSMGALVAFELVRRLRFLDLPTPSFLLVSAHRAPQLENPARRQHPLTKDEVRDHLSALGGSTAELLRSDEFLEFLLPRLHADFAACETYSYVDERPLDCPIVAIGGAFDKDVPSTALEPWRIQTHGEFSHHELSGGHFFLHTHEAELLRLVSSKVLRDSLSVGHVG